MSPPFAHLNPPSLTPPLPSTHLALTPTHPTPFPPPPSVDPKLAEFLNLMQPRSKAKIWANDDVAPLGSAEAKVGGRGVTKGGGGGYPIWQ